MSETFCVLPWIHLATHPNGGVSLCCRSNHTNAISWAKDQKNDLMTLDNSNLDDIVNCKTFTRVRGQMIDGEQPIECEGCWADEDRGIKSKRQYENERWTHAINNSVFAPTLEKADYKYVELRLGNVCNTACITCNSYSSSKWLTDEKEISKKLIWFESRAPENYKWFENTQFYSDLALRSQHVEEIYINGGEPTLIKAHYNYLQHLIDSETAKNVHIVYSLNMTSIPDRLLNLLKNFKKVTINCSIDDVELRNYYIRWPTDWNDVVNSLYKLNSQPNISWHVTQTVSILNVFNITDLDTWLQEKYNKKTALNYVLYPEYLSFASLPDNIKTELKTLYKNAFNDDRDDELQQKLNIKYDGAMHLKAKEFITELDKVRNLNYCDYVPELQKIIK
jgi:MoaA/NifB/PqqE/SkfB family radical SAM enzyme